ncbi:aconitate hydratase [Mycobacteroides abscessus subsp. abscessus]|nr:aconitate hydratase [Mycobacteroides abscessus subsp. abscessus]
MGPETLNLMPGDRIEIDAPSDAIAPRVGIPVRVLRANGDVLAFDARAAVETQLDVRLLREGGVIPAILLKTLAMQEAA